MVIGGAIGIRLAKKVEMTEICLLYTSAVESGAGQLASFDDKAFVQAGAEIVEGNSVWQSEIILKVNAPLDDEIALLNPGTTLVSFIWPAQNPELMQKLAERNVTVMAMDSVPRISRDVYKRQASTSAVSVVRQLYWRREVLRAWNVLNIRNWEWKPSGKLKWKISRRL